MLYLTKASYPFWVIQLIFDLHQVIVQLNFRLICKTFQLLDRLFRYNNVKF
ncbi:hypothetical protein CYK57_00141 [Actinobacillus pleuropneumoniae]|nr:hypothetical protein CYK57_00141 [Actinobacillus pleuropneumoniae]